MKKALPDELRKDYGIKIRFTLSEKNIILKQVQKHKCKSMADYIRKLVKNDINKIRP